MITRFPAEELLVAGGGHPTVFGPLPGVREPQSNLNNPVDAVVESARSEGALVDPDQKTVAGSARHRIPSAASAAEGAAVDGD